MKALTQSERASHLASLAEAAPYIRAAVAFIYVLRYGVDKRQEAYMVADHALRTLEVDIANGVPVGE